MRERIYTWRIVVSNIRSNEREYIVATEEYDSIQAVWEELLLICFHRNDQNLYRRYSLGVLLQNLTVRIQVWLKDWSERDVNVGLTLSLDLDIRPYLECDEINLIHHLAITKADILQLHEYTQEYLQKHSIDLYRIRYLCLPETSTLDEVIIVE